MGLVCLSLSACKDAPAPLATANFYVDGDECVSPCTVHFYDQSMNAVKWRWEFGNGTSSPNQDDSTTYTDNNIYTVKLTVWNSDDVPDSVSKTVTIY